MATENSGTLRGLTPKTRAKIEAIRKRRLEREAKAKEEEVEDGSGARQALRERQTKALEDEGMSEAQYCFLCQLAKESLLLRAKKSYDEVASRWGWKEGFFDLLQAADEAELIIPMFTWLTEKTQDWRDRIAVMMADIRRQWEWEQKRLEESIPSDAPNDNDGRGSAESA